MNKIEPYSLLVGIVVFFMTYCFLSGIENTIFWSKVVELRESTGRIDSFALAHDYKLVINTEILFYHFLFVIIAYSIASIAITRIVKKI
ncbi:hypothetical protein KCM76_06790 [Zooshikella marina]|uniref:hypothetical protein n=1 Tax=Zooshikella ganghwensis TaxID=202772 RepID=UPI001BB084D9|nr:hypothetical protein [Zooshikella ganghwensis]MBU2705680.1 hypothetical protein [Zooshikella ganghwensis]